MSSKSLIGFFMSSRSRETADVYIDQDQLGRTYSGTNAPVRDKERLGDVWFVEEATAVRLNKARLSKQGKRSLSKRTSYYKKGVN